MGKSAWRADSRDDSRSAGCTMRRAHRESGPCVRRSSVVIAAGDEPAPEIDFGSSDAQRRAGREVSDPVSTAGAETVRAVTLIRQSLTYYWRTNLAVVFGVAIAVSVLAGAALAGESVRARRRALFPTRPCAP